MRFGSVVVLESGASPPTSATSSVLTWSVWNGVSLAPSVDNGAPGHGRERRVSGGIERPVPALEQHARRPGRAVSAGTPVEPGHDLADTVGVIEQRNVHNEQARVSKSSRPSSCRSHPPPGISAPRPPTVAAPTSAPPRVRMPVRSSSAWRPSPFSPPNARSPAVSMRFSVCLPLFVFFDSLLIDSWIGI
jgi:hypothetical protein